MTKSRNYHLKLSEDAYLALQEIADKEGRLLSDVIREALKEYTTRKGYTVSFKVGRGGNRRGKSEDGSEEE
jgi:hypothetical protein